MNIKAKSSSLTSLTRYTLNAQCYLHCLMCALSRCRSKLIRRIKHLQNSLLSPCCLCIISIIGAAMKISGANFGYRRGWRRFHGPLDGREASCDGQAQRSPHQRWNLPESTDQWLSMRCAIIAHTHICIYIYIYIYLPLSLTRQAFFDQKEDLALLRTWGSLSSAGFVVRTKDGVKRTNLIA